MPPSEACAACGSLTQFYFSYHGWCARHYYLANFIGLLARLREIDMKCLCGHKIGVHTFDSGRCCVFNCTCQRFDDHQIVQKVLAK